MKKFINNNSLNTHKTLFTIIAFGFLTIYSYNLYGQADCSIGFKYVGKINSDKAIVDSIELPTTKFLKGDTIGKRTALFRKYSISDGIINCKLRSDMGGEYCSNEYYKTVFKRNELKFYQVFIIFKGRQGKLKLNIPIENINFIEVDDRLQILTLIIDFGEIKI